MTKLSQNYYTLIIIYYNYKRDKKELNKIIK